MTKPNIVFSHGKESGPWGSKISEMVEHIKNMLRYYGLSDHKIHSIDYQDLESPDDRVDRLVNYLESLKGDIILVGSSMGGYVSAVASNHIEVKGLLLLAPAFYLPDYAIAKPTTSCNNVTIIHGWNDEVVPYQNSVEFAEKHKAKLVLVDDGHRLCVSAERFNYEIENLVLKKRKL